MTTFTLLFCAIVLSLSFNYGNAVSNFRFPNGQLDWDYTVDSQTEMAKRRSLIKDMTRGAYQQAKDWPGLDNAGRGLKVIQMLSTLLVMGLSEEYEEGKRWIADHFNSCDALKDMKWTFLTSTEYMGSLLSCYALTNDTAWLDSAKLVGAGLKMEFNTPTGLPNKVMTSKRSRYYSDNDNNLAEVGGQHLEFIYLADLTNDLDMKTKVRKARTFLQNVEKPNNGLYMHSIDVSSGKWTSRLSSLIWPASTFYQYLIKSYVQSNGQDGQAIEMYREAIDAVVNNLVIQKSCQNHLTYAVLEPNKASKNNMNYDACYLGAMLALGANAMQQQLDHSPSTVSNVIQQQTCIEQHWTLAREITETCHRHANSSTTKLPSQSKTDKSFSFGLAAAYAESYFVLWRLTHEYKYRDYAWELAQAIHENCRTDGRNPGYYFHLNNVEGGYQAVKQKWLRFLVSHTLKYLYLTFSDDSLLPLDQWVFNRAGQPFPIRGRNPAYPAQTCV